MVFSRLTESLTRRIEDVIADTTSSLLDPVIRLGVTGLARSGKTVFITSLVSNLLERGRMPQLQAVADGRIVAAYLQPQPDHSIPRFAYEDHLAALTGPDPRWPDNTRAISTLRLSLKVTPRSMLSGLTGPRTVHLDIIDYPGEWLLDLPLMNQTFGDWSREAFVAARTPARAAHSAPWLAQLAAVNTAAPLDETVARTLAQGFTAYLAASRAAGLSSVAPDRFLMPGDLKDSPALTFCPLPDLERAATNSLWRAFEKRFESYKRLVVEPFFRNHFTRIDRQVVLIDALGAIHEGPPAVEDLRAAMTDILRCFRPGPNSWLTPILGRRIDRILFAATKADYLHHEQHAKLTAVTEALVSDARARALFQGAKVGAMSIASVRSTVEQILVRDGVPIGVVRGRRSESGLEAALFPGNLPNDPAKLLVPAREGAGEWYDAAYSVTQFSPPPQSLVPGEGLPHIRLDRAAEFLIGDRL